MYVIRMVLSKLLDRVGVFGLGALINFTLDPTSNSNDNNKKNKVPCVVLTVGFNFWIPIWRDLLLALGMRSVSRQCMEGLLRNQPDTSLVIMLGGAREAQFREHRTPRIILNRRLGLFKLAMKHKVPLVPVFTFGELETFKDIVGLRGVGRVAMFVKWVTGVLPVLFWPLVPMRRPLDTFIGEPVLPQNYDSPEAFQAAFRNALLKMYNQHYQKYDYSVLKIIE